MADSLLERGIEAARTGRLEAARGMLAQVVQRDRDSEQGWLWLAAVAKDDWQKLYCLRQVERINPQNQTAARGVRALSVRLEPAQEGVHPGPGRPAHLETETPQPVRAPRPAAATPTTEPSVRGRGTLLSLGAFVVQRLLFGALVLVAISFLSYLGLDMAGGTPLGDALSSAARNTVSYLGQILRGDWGISEAGGYTLALVPVAEVLADTLPKSLGLLATSLLLASLIGIVLGIWAAKRRHSKWSLVTLMTSIAGVSMPSFVAALVLQLAAIQWTRTFGRPLLPVGGFGWDEHLLLPALVLTARPVAQIARVTFVSIGQLLDQDFVRTAHSKGLASRLVMYRHVMRNAAIPILTTMGVSLRFSLSSLPVVEFFFGWPGVGFTLLRSISRRDDDLTVALVLCLGTLFVLVNLLLEATYRVIDPRLRQRVARAEQQERENLFHILQSILVGLWDWLTNLPLWEWLALRKPVSPVDPLRNVLKERGLEVDANGDEYRVERRRAWIRGTVSNLPFVLGSTLVLGLLIAFVFGPRLAPYSPYTTRGLEYKDGELTVPPFAPGDEYPWGTDPLGRDVLSLILVGIQQTLLLTLLVVTARVAVGFALGALAGWLHESWVDRTLLALAEVIAAFPALLLAMTLILALGIRQGMPPFVLALCFVGWGEIMQFVRGEVMSIRVRPFIESAVATGLRTPRIVLSHVLPNLLPSLISIAALEMGAVLMILGELGFVGIFIGGGAFAEMDVAAAPYHYSDVPEWGALLSNVRRYARAYPWTATYPAMAFFVAILGFNLFGEGIRRMIETVGVGVTRLVNRYTIALALVVALAAGWVRANTGSVAVYRRQAADFDGGSALAYVQALADPALQGRALGTSGPELAAQYVADQFRALGIQPGGQDMGYFQNRTRSCEILDAVPELNVQGQPALTYRQDYVEYPSSERNLGQFEGSVRLLATGELMGAQTWAATYYEALEGIDASGQVLLLLSPRDAFYTRYVPRGGVLVVADEGSDLRQRYTLSSRDPVWRLFGTGREIGQDAPMLWVSASVADRLLLGTGRTVADLRLQAKEFERDQVLDVAIDTTVALQVEGTVHDKIPVRHVIGHLPGLSDSRYGGLNNQVIVVLAQYDSPPISPEGALYPAANDNASAVATMLEVIRTMRDTGYQPYRTFLFIAYSGEGLEGGQPVLPSEVGRFLQAKHGFAASLKVEAIVHLRGLGGGDGDGLLLSASGSRRLARLFEQAARQMDVKLQPAKEPVDISIVFEEKSSFEGGQEAPEVVLNWAGWQETSGLPTDTVESVSADKLERAGRALTLALMTMGRELNY